MKDSSFLSRALSSGVSPNALLAEQPKLGAGHPPTCARIGLAQRPSQPGVDTLELSKLVGEDLLVGEVLSSPKVLLGGGGEEPGSERHTQISSVIRSIVTLNLDERFKSIYYIYLFIHHLVTYSLKVFYGMCLIIPRSMML